MKDRWLPVSAVQKRLNVSRSHAYALIGQGQFTALRVGGAIRVSERSVDAYIARQISLFTLETGFPSTESTESVEYSESADGE